MTWPSCTSKPGAQRFSNRMPDVLSVPVSPPSTTTVFPSTTNVRGANELNAHPARRSRTVSLEGSAFFEICWSVDDPFDVIGTEGQKPIDVAFSKTIVDMLYDFQRCCQLPPHVFLFVAYPTALRPEERRRRICALLAHEQRHDIRTKRPTSSRQKTES
jgi:hypothetical protein